MTNGKVIVIYFTFSYSLTYAHNLLHIQITYMYAINITSPDWSSLGRGEGGHRYLGHDLKSDFLDDKLLREDTFSSLKSRPGTPAATKPGTPVSTSMMAFDLRDDPLCKVKDTLPPGNTGSTRTISPVPYDAKA